jgi:hypothetical protein
MAPGVPLDASVGRASGESSTSNASAGSESDIQKLLSQRTQILGTKLEVVAGQIVERIRLRKANLEALVAEEVEVDTELMRFETNLYARANSHLVSTFQNRRFDIGREKRLQDVECWRDLVHVIREFLQIWEDLQQSRVRDQLLYGPPTSEYENSGVHDEL